MRQPNQFDKLLCTSLGAGYCPFAPGTMGALVGVLFWVLGYLILYPFGLGEAGWITIQLINFFCILFFTFISIQPINRLETIWGEDPSRVVIDETVGVWICLLGVPCCGIGEPRLWIYVILAFALFRFFDILKPLGIRRMEQLPGGWGVMMDDVLAGIWGLLIMITSHRFF